MRFKLRHRKDGYYILAGPYVLTMAGAIEEVSNSMFPIDPKEFDIFIYINDEWREI